MTKTITAVDLFCGAGGTSTGLLQAANNLNLPVELIAINHWQVAIDTHSHNHQNVKHLCADIETLKPYQLIPSRRLKLLLASPECTHHSNARGGKPRDEQKRADAWDLLRWTEKLFIENMIVENVPEFRDWGPLRADGKPDKRHKGLYFKQFIDTLKINYSVDYRILNAADYGDATSRKRLFIIAKRPKGRRIIFPKQTHIPKETFDKVQSTAVKATKEMQQLKQWRAAREVIDWSLKGKSIFNRPKPLAPNTMKRIMAGLYKYGLKSFLLNMKGSTRRDRSIEEPLFTQTAKSQHQYLVEPFLVNLSHTKNNDASMCIDIEKPLTTICGKGMYAIIEPFLLKYYGGHHSAPLSDPLPTITASYEHYALIEPFLIKFNNNQDAFTLDAPLNTLTTKDRFAICTSADEPGEKALYLPDLNIIIDVNFRMLQPNELAAAMSFPKDYHFTGNRNDKVKQIGNAVPVKVAQALIETTLTN